MTKVSTTDTYTIPGVYEPIEYIVETHTICDVCGSSDISYKRNAHLPFMVERLFSIIILISFCGAVAIALGLMLLGNFNYNRIIFGLGLISVLAFLAYGGLTVYVERDNGKNPKCNACGNKHIT